MSRRNITAIVLKFLFAAGLIVSTGCKRTAPESRPAPTNVAPEPQTPVVPANPRKDRGKLTAPEEEEDWKDDEDEDDVPLNYSLALGAATNHDVQLHWSDDGTDVIVTTTLAGRPQNLGSIQSEHQDQVIRIAAVEACERDADPDPELCVRYRADPLGSTREDPYDAETVFDVTGGRVVRVTPK